MNSQQFSNIQHFFLNFMEKLISVDVVIVGKIQDLQDAIIAADLLQNPIGFFMLTSDVKL